MRRTSRLRGSRPQRPRGEGDRLCAAAISLAALLATSAAQAQPEAQPKAPQAAAAAPAEETWYAERFGQSQRGLQLTHFWSKGRKLRVETSVSGVPVLTIVNGAHYYAIDALHGFGVAIERSAKALAQDARGGRPFGGELEAVRAEGGEKVDTEELGGRALDVYRVTDDTGRRQVWVTQEEPKLPVRIEFFDRASGQTSRADYLGWLRKLEIPDTFFEPDPRFKIEPVSYDDYVKRAAKEPIGPVPVLFGDLLHGKR